MNTLAEMHAAHKERQLRAVIGAQEHAAFMGRCETILAWAVAVRWTTAIRAAESTMAAIDLAMRVKWGAHPGKRPPAVILGEVAEKHGLQVGELVGRSRFVPIPAARFEAFYRLRAEMKWSLPRIGKFMGGRDHTTVMHGILKHCEKRGLSYPRPYLHA